MPRKCRRRHAALVRLKGSFESSVGHQLRAPNRAAEGSGLLIRRGESPNAGSTKSPGAILDRRRRAPKGGEARDRPSNPAARTTLESKGVGDLTCLLNSGHPKGCVIRAHYSPPIWTVKPSGHGRCLASRWHPQGCGNRVVRLPPFRPGLREQGELQIHRTVFDSLTGRHMSDGSSNPVRTLDYDPMINFVA